MPGAVALGHVVYLLAHLAIAGQQSEPHIPQLLLDLPLELLQLLGQGMSFMIEGPASPTGHAMIKVGVSKRLTRVSHSL